MATKTSKKPQKKRPLLEEAELLSYIPPKYVGTKKIPNVPYVKSFSAENPERTINGSRLLYTACSDKKWTAPGTKKNRRNFA